MEKKRGEKENGTEGKKRGKHKPFESIDPYVCLSAATNVLDIQLKS